MKMSEDPKVWKRIGYGLLVCIATPILIFPLLITLALYSIGRSFDEYMEDRNP